MKLYYFKNAGSLAVRIIINELELACNYEAVKELRVKDKVLESGGVFSDVSQKNQIPALALDDGRILTEIWVIMTYLAELKSEKRLLGEGFTRYRVMEWLSFISTELHKNFVPIISPIVPVEAKPVFMKILTSKLNYIEKELEGRDFLSPPTFTVADAYLFTILSWLKFIKIDIADFSNISRYFNALKERSSILKSFTDEGIEF
jgi:glutathione S-transferase